MKIIGAASLVVLMLTVGCTSVRVYGLDEVGADLPLEVGDEVRVFRIAEPAEVIEVRVTALSANSLSGVSISDSGAELEIDWDQISRIETRRADTGKTTVLVVILLLLGAVAAEVSEDIEDLFDGIFGQDD